MRLLHNSWHAPLLPMRAGKNKLREPRAAGKRFSKLPSASIQTMCSSRLFLGGSWDRFNADQQTLWPSDPNHLSSGFPWDFVMDARVTHPDLTFRTDLPISLLLEDEQLQAPFWVLLHKLSGWRLLPSPKTRPMGQGCLDKGAKEGAGSFLMLLLQGGVWGGGLRS